MEVFTYALKWSEAILRWWHVLFAILWVGNSFLFNYLDNNLLKDFMSRGSKTAKTQKELAEGWRLVLPYPKHRTKIFNNRDGTISRKKYPIYNRFNVNLAQLPNHLWDKLKFNYTDGKLTHFI